MYGISRSMSKLAVVSILLASPSAFAWTGKASRVGDIVYKTTGLDAFFLGHVGVLYSGGTSDGTGTTRLVSDVSTGRGDSALGITRDIITFEGSDYDGARRMPSQKYFGLTLAQQASLKARIAYYRSSRVQYDDNHLDQKGAWFNHNFPWEPHSHWEFDCVGFVERIYEDIGLNPTPNEGSFLTPARQRDATTAAPYYVNRTIKSCATGASLAPTEHIDLTTGYNNYTCASRYQEQCIDDGTFDQYYDEVCGV